MRVVVSPFDDPFLNLVLEEWLAERCGCDQFVMLWVNRPCVVIGINQNPWLECNPAELKQYGVLLVRRKSGGGAVYHDPGNLNISFIGPRRAALPRRNLGMLQEWMGSLGLKADIDERYRLLVDGRKISGSAFRWSARFFVHHATLLVSCDVTMMERVLAPSIQVVETAAVRSEPHVVANVGDLVPESDDRSALLTAAMDFWAGPKEKADPCLRSLVNEEKLEMARRVSQLRSWDWVFGRTPFTRVMLWQGEGQRLVAEVRRGLMESVYVEEGGERKVQLWRGSLRFDLQLAKALTHGPSADGFGRLAADKENTHCLP